MQCVEIVIDSLYITMFIQTFRKKPYQEQWKCKNFNIHFLTFFTGQPLKNINKKLFDYKIDAFFWFYQRDLSTLEPWGEAEVILTLGLIGLRKVLFSGLMLRLCKK